MSYATRNDVFDLGLSAQAFVVRARPIPEGDVDIATGVIRLKAHGLAPADFVVVEVTSGGSLPTGLSAHQAYPVEPIEFDLFRLKDPVSGAPITSYVSAGAGWAVAVDLMRRLDRHLEAASARIDEHLTAHTPPLDEPYPMQVVEVCARLAARRMLTTLQFDNAAFRTSADELRATAEQDEATLQRWLAGKPVHPRPLDQTPTVADNGARARAGRKPTRWTTGSIF